MVSECKQGRNRGAVVGVQRRCVGRTGSKSVSPPAISGNQWQSEALCWAHRIEERLAGGCASEAAEDGRVEGCDRSIHIGIVHLWGEGAVMSTCMRLDRSTLVFVRMPHPACNQRSSATIRHAISGHQARNQPTFGSRHWSASLVSARCGEHMHAGQGILGERAL